MKTLVVMRHGKAMPPMQDQHDADRSLTEAGIRALDVRLPHMLRLLETSGGVAQIWTSPARRACQTAELLESALRKSRIPHKRRIEPHDCLWEQDLDGFLDDLRASKADLIFAVGHAPFVEDVVEELAGSTPPFSTGALGCLEVRDTITDLQDTARLLWFAQGPVSAHWDTLVQLQAALTRTVEAIEDRRQAFFAEPEDIETIHRFRTNIRTLRSLVAFIKPWQNRKENAEIQAALKEVVGYNSRLRELDVLEKLVRSDPDSSPKLLAFCKQEASAERAKVLKVLASKRVSRKYGQALSLASDVTWRKRHARHGLSRNLVRARFDGMIESVRADLATLDLNDDERTHDVRKRAKRARYVAEFDGAVLGADALGIAKGMTAHQDALGDVCDARANIRLIDEFLQRDLPKAAVRAFASMRKQNEALLRNALNASKAMEE